MLDNHGAIINRCEKRDVSWARHPYTDIAARISESAKAERVNPVRARKSGIKVS